MDASCTHLDLDPEGFSGGKYSGQVYTRTVRNLGEDFHGLLVDRGVITKSL